jgi:putative tryptophan/tyrosine transport system substrate-binding protein
MRRRKFITLLSGAAAWPLAARAQEPEHVRRIVVLMSLAADDKESQVRLAAFIRALQDLGWTTGRDLLPIRGDPGQTRTSSSCSLRRREREW